MLAAEPVGALDLAGKVSAQAPAASVCAVPPGGQKASLHPHAGRLWRATGGTFTLSLLHRPCPYYFQAYGTYPCFAQGYYPYPAYSYGFGFGGPFWRGGFGDDD
jgi:hypothetical protein